MSLVLARFISFAIVAPVVVVALLAVLGWCELTTRRWLARRGFYSRYRPHYRELAHLDAKALPQLTRVVRIETNRDGERGGPPPARGEEAYRALVLGGSAAECYYLDQEEVWSRVVERRLSTPEALARIGKPRVHVGNIARSGLRVEHLQVLFERSLPRYPRLDLVVLMVGASDLITWVERKMPRVVTEPTPAAGRIYEHHPEGPWGWGWRTSAIGLVARELARSLLHPVTHSHGVGAWLTAARKMRAEAPRVITETPDASVMLDHMEVGLRAMLRTARAVSNRVLLVRQPWLGKQLTAEEQKLMWNYGFGRPYKEQVDTYLSPAVIDDLLTQVASRCGAVAREMGAEELDLLPQLERTGRTFYDFMHFTAYGSERVGELVAEAILEGTRQRRNASSNYANAS